MIRPNEGGYGDDDAPKSGYRWVYSVRRKGRPKWVAIVPCRGGKQFLGTHGSPRSAWQAVRRWVAAGCKPDAHWHQNYKPRVGGGRKGRPEVEAAVGRLLADLSLSNRQIAAAAGVPKGTVDSIRQRLGLPPREAARLAAIAAVLKARPETPDVTLARQLKVGERLVQVCRRQLGLADHPRVRSNGRPLPRPVNPPRERPAC